MHCLKEVSALHFVAAGNASFAGDGNTIVGDTRDLNSAQVKVGGYVNGEAQTELVISEGEPRRFSASLVVLLIERRLIWLAVFLPMAGAMKHAFAESVTYQEQEWLAQVINEAIERANNSYDDNDNFEDLR